MIGVQTDTGSVLDNQFACPQRTDGIDTGVILHRDGFHSVRALQIAVVLPIRPHEGCGTVIQRNQAVQGDIALAFVGYLQIRDMYRVVQHVLDIAGSHARSHRNIVLVDLRIYKAVILEQDVVQDDALVRMVDDFHGRNNRLVVDRDVTADIQCNAVQVGSAVYVVRNILECNDVAVFTGPDFQFPLQADLADFAFLADIDVDAACGVAQIQHRRGNRHAVFGYEFIRIVRFLMDETARCRVVLDSLGIKLLRSRPQFSADIGESLIQCGFRSHLTCRGIEVFITDIQDRIGGALGR